MSLESDQNPLAIEPMAVARLRPYGGNARTHSKKQIQQIANSIRTFGFTNPVLIGDGNEIIAGHGRVEAAKLTVPTLVDGRVVLKKDSEVRALNELQYLKAAANIYFLGWKSGEKIKAEFESKRERRVEDWSRIIHLIPAGKSKTGEFYRVGTGEEAKKLPKSMIKVSFIPPVPSQWPPQLKYRDKPKTFYNGTGIGHVRREEWLSSDATY